MFQRRFMLGITAFGIIVAATGCSEKAAPTPTESAIRQDRAISEAIMDAIRKDVALSDDIPNFQVITVKGEATVYGAVDNELERSHAEKIAAEAQGVRGVTSRIRLSNEPLKTASRR